MKLSKPDHELSDSIKDLSDKKVCLDSVIRKRYGDRLFNKLKRYGLIKKVGSACNLTTTSRILIYHSDFPKYKLLDFKVWVSSNLTVIERKKRVERLEFEGNSSEVDIENVEEIIQRYPRTISKTYNILCVIWDVQITQFKEKDNVPNFKAIVKYINNNTKFRCVLHGRWNEGYVYKSPEQASSTE